jgi:hypothetical protein
MAFTVVQRILRGSLVGLAVGAICLLAGLGRALVVILEGDKVDFAGFGAGAIIYAAGFVLGGALVGALWSFRSTDMGRSVVWLAGGCGVSMGVVTLTSGFPWMWSVGEWIAVGFLGCFVGFAFGYGFDKSEA